MGVLMGPYNPFDVAELALIEMSRLQRWALVCANAGELDAASELDAETQRRETSTDEMEIAA